MTSARAWLYVPQNERKIYSGKEKELEFYSYKCQNMNKIARKPYIAMSGNRRIQHIKVRKGFISWWVAIRVLGTQGGPKQSNRKMETNYFT